MRRHGDDKLLKKLKKLERKIKKRERRPRRRRVLSSSSENEPEIEIPLEEDQMHEDIIMIDEEIQPGKHDDSLTEQLNDSIISALGDSASAEKIYAEEIHSEVVKRVENIIVSGMDKNIKEDIFKKYNIPKNLLLLEAPKLNVELEGLLTENIKERDKRVEERQQQLGIALSAVLTVVNKFVKANKNAGDIQILTDVCRLLSDLHFADTVTRRKLISINLDKNVVKAIESTKRDCYLFSEKFNDNVKTANAIKKAAPSILKKTIPTTKSAQPRSSYYKNKENFQAPPRPSRAKQGRGGRYQHRSTGKQHQARGATGRQTYRHKAVRQT